MNAELVQFKTQIDTSVLNKEIVILSQEDYTHYGDVMKLCKNKIKEVDEERKSYTDPLEKSKKLLIAKAKEIIEPIEKYVEKISGVMSVWYMAEEKRRQDEQKRLEAEAIKNAKPEETDVIVPVVESVKTVRGDVSTSTAIKYNDFELVNIDEVPREYLMLDESKVKEAINKSGINSISGIKIIKKIRFNSR